MDVIRIVLILIATALICVTLRASKPELAMAVALAAGAGVLVMSLDDIKKIADSLNEISTLAGMSGAASGLMLRAAGIALVSEFGVQLLKDAGETALAGRIELYVRVSLLAMAVPLIQQMLTLITEALA